MDATTKKKRLSKKTVRVVAWAAGGAAFALPWVAFQFVPVATTTARSTTPQVIVVPAGSTVTVLNAPAGATGVKVIRSSATTTSTSAAPTVKSAPVTTTGASAPPP